MTRRQLGPSTARFFLIGGSATILNIILLWLLAGPLRQWYLGASVVSYSVCIAYNFALQKVWAFSGTGGSILKQLPQFIGINLLCLLLNTVMLCILVNITNLPVVLCQVTASLAICGLSFLAYRRIFSPRTIAQAAMLPVGDTRQLVHAGERVRASYRFARSQCRVIAVTACSLLFFTSTASARTDNIETAGQIVTLALPVAAGSITVAKHD